ncbi:hypothetical protein [Aquibacillus albus]|uniref:Uncharacterized protein n=1 Tax=Aquibacillus albus TaxID=1168171 RepID=A0ABS2N2J4_9BACI|nr:hypothetical protein [Aquibacillus albus]MBM7572361.1 hypothetical protein [Aquibacillus albus]
MENVKFNRLFSYGIQEIHTKRGNTKLEEHYSKFGAESIGLGRMAINEIASKELIELYLYKGE